MYAGLGEEQPVIFLPGSLTPREPERKTLVVLKPPPPPPPRKPLVVLKQAPTPAPEASPLPVIVSDMYVPPTEPPKSRLPLYLAGGALLVGLGFLVLRR